MRWQIASARALEVAAWSFAPVSALAAHHAVRLKFAFLQQHQFAIAYVNDACLRSEHLWKLMEHHYGWFCFAAFLFPAIGCFIQHLGLRWWWRLLIAFFASIPALAYASMALHLFGKVVTHAP
ncbi:hypothetical protein [Prosthecobacter sp.]|uniref:hypothetical protein n=1 Tax=Prosthecobacter sp. TaxID=1965333 RepID=UPI0037838377